MRLRELAAVAARRARRGLGALLLGGCALAPLHAAGLDDEARQKAAATARQVFEEAEKAATHGPANVALVGQGRLQLPQGLIFVPQPQATRMLNAMGNPGSDPRLQGLLLPADDANWFIVMRFEQAGYIKDDDARDWNADELLKSMREGTEQSNAERTRMGVPAIEVEGWAEKPAYDAASHRLVWALSSREKGAGADQARGVNYNTYVLGREGYFSMNLVTELSLLPQHRPQAQSLLAALQFDEGKRYQDFDVKTDRVAEYGLAALVVGVAAKKLGMIALALAFLAKFAKIIMLGLALFGGAAWKLIGGRRGKAAAMAAAAPAPAPPPLPPGA